MLHCSIAMQHWLASSDAVVVYGAVPGWGSAVESFLQHNFKKETGNASGPRVYGA